MYFNNFNFSNENDWLNSINKDNFEANALLLFKFQYNNNAIYKAYVDLICKDFLTIDSLLKIPFLPIHFFKTHKVIIGPTENATIFESSGTTQTINSKHIVNRLDIYEQSFIQGFEKNYGAISDYVFLCLLPSYLERKNSSLVYMAKYLVEHSGQAESGFYLDNFDALAAQLIQLKASNKKVILLGVTFALIDFATAYPMDLNGIIVMETGGMKGRKEEWTKIQVHNFLKQQWHLKEVHAEYGMTELLSQAYALGNDRYSCSNTMKVLTRSISDPFELNLIGKGAINIIDLANIYSCAFIATEDVGNVYDDEKFTIQGRLDYSALRGCSLMAL